MSVADSNLTQFPLRQNVVTQCVRDGLIWYSYVVEYDFQGVVDTFYIWAQSQEDAETRMQHVMMGCTIKGPLADLVSHQ